MHQLLTRPTAPTASTWLHRCLAAEPEALQHQAEKVLEVLL